MMVAMVVVMMMVGSFVIFTTEVDAAMVCSTPFSNKFKDVSASPGGILIGVGSNRDVSIWSGCSWRSMGAMFDQISTGGRGRGAATSSGDLYAWARTDAGDVYYYHRYAWYHVMYGAQSFTGGAPGYIYATGHMSGYWSVFCARASAPGERLSWLTTSINLLKIFADVYAVGCSPNECWACDALYRLWRKPNVDCSNTTWVRASGPDAPALPKKIEVDSAGGVYLHGNNALLYHRAGNETAWTQPMPNEYFKSITVHESNLIVIDDTGTMKICKL
ncbi:uncharacterized protein LOC133339099 isoform X2 [Lethenteron reissneri]|uniref:uncharacterized protein LOC133339099 isoform X2 n=1 Tax=Lethenteron reissneri TaxID=7753 RepID=UPI002AB6030C|nr:uncharacterized protein LOC133339099 isoform X2 [Lethenteron reissneri]